MSVSARNQITGTVQSIKQDEIMAEVVVKLQSGEELVSVITSASAQRLGLSSGKQVTIVIKSTDVMLEN
jgi:molybdopterin-binding protein